MTVAVAQPLEGCQEVGPLAYDGQMVLVKRGNCTFLEKATIALAGGARMLVIVNTEDRIEAVATGIGIDKDVTVERVKPLDDFSVVSWLLCVTV